MANAYATKVTVKDINLWWTDQDLSLPSFPIFPPFHTNCWVGTLIVSEVLITGAFPVSWQWLVTNCRMFCHLTTNSSAHKRLTSNPDITMTDLRFRCRPIWPGKFQAEPEEPKCQAIFFSLLCKYHMFTETPQEYAIYTCYPHFIPTQQPYLPYLF